MKDIKIKILNECDIYNIEKMTVKTAMLTQHGHEISDMDSFDEFFDKPYSQETLEKLCRLPHPTIRKFGVIHIVIVGASRSFLEHITRHQNEVKFMSASLHYSKYDRAEYVIPLSLRNKSEELAIYKKSCEEAIANYKALADKGYSVQAGNIMPRAMRNTLIISATPFQWVHMCQQRSCCRNTEETRYIMYTIACMLKERSPALFWDVFPECTRTKCPEGKMCCGKVFEEDSNKMTMDILDWRCRSE